jgi:hypothetical protein
MQMRYLANRVDVCLELTRGHLKHHKVCSSLLAAVLFDGYKLTREPDTAAVKELSTI